MDKRDECPPFCENCGKPDVKRMIEAGTFHLDGVGWHKDDYTKTGPKKGY